MDRLDIFAIKKKQEGCLNFLYCTSFHVSKRLRLPAKKSFFALWLMSMKMGLLGSKKKWARAVARNCP